MPLKISLQASVEVPWTNAEQRTIRL